MKPQLLHGSSPHSYICPTSFNPRTLVRSGGMLFEPGRHAQIRLILKTAEIQIAVIHGSFGWDFCLQLDTVIFLSRKHGGIILRSDTPGGRLTRGGGCSSVTGPLEVFADHCMPHAMQKETG